MMSNVVNSSPRSSLEPIEDRFSIVLSRLERIEASLSGLKDVKKLLEEIEDNTHPDGHNKSDFRHNMEKVGFEIIVEIIKVLSCLYGQSSSVFHPLRLPLIATVKFNSHTAGMN